MPDFSCFGDRRKQTDRLFSQGRRRRAGQNFTLPHGQKRQTGRRQRTVQDPVPAGADSTKKRQSPFKRDCRPETKTGVSPLGNAG